jgi:hypothetical protein
LTFVWQNVFLPVAAAFTGAGLYRVASEVVPTIMRFFCVVILSSLGAVYGNQIILTQNAIVNPGAELGAGSPDGTLVEPVPDWATNGNFTVVQYGSPNEIENSPGADFGSNFFAGGPDNASSSATQALDVSNISSLINAGLVNYTMSGYFGGYITQDDSATLTATFLGVGLTTLAQVSVGGDNEVARNGTTELLFSSVSGMIPVGTDAILFTLQMTRTEGTYNDGYADNLSFIAVDPPPSSGVVPEPSGWGLSCFGLAGFGLAALAKMAWRRPAKIRA